MKNEAAERARATFAGEPAENDPICSVRFCGLSELGELLVASKAMRALVDSYLQLLQTLRAELLTPSDSERRLLARAGGRVQNLRTFLMNWLRPRPESICAKLRSSLHLAHSAN